VSVDPIEDGLTFQLYPTPNDAESNGTSGILLASVYGSSYAPVCSNGFSDSVADVACSRLGVDSSNIVWASGQDLTSYQPDIPSSFSVSLIICTQQYDADAGKRVPVCGYQPNPSCDASIEGVHLQCSATAYPSGSTYESVFNTMDRLRKTANVFSAIAGIVVLFGILAGIGQIPCFRPQTTSDSAGVFGAFVSIAMHISAFSSDVYAVALN